MQRHFAAYMRARFYSNSAIRPTNQLFSLLAHFQTLSRRRREREKERKKEYEQEIVSTCYFVEKKMSSLWCAVKLQWIAKKKPESNTTQKKTRERRKKKTKKERV